MLWFGFSSYGQFTLSGKITNEKNQPLTGSHIHTKYLNTASNPIGEFEINGLPKGELRVYISYLGYTTCDTLVDMTEDVVLNVKLKTKTDVMSEVVVEGESTNKRLKKVVALNTEVVNNTFIQKNLGGSLMQTLERVGGISTISIGSGQSKPMIRGLGFNRVVVTENGVKHEGQQWGADHGLEIDQFAVDEVKIVKGPASLQFGSDAIGGVIEVEKSRTPEKNTFGGSAVLTGKTNNNLYGSSVNLFRRKESFFIDTRLTYLDYADYKVPTDFISIYSYRAPLYKNKLRNTAGNEFNAHLTTGISKDNYSSVFYISNLRTKSGLFANAHGLEPRNVDTDLHDASDRDIQNPYQFVNHFKIINRTRITQEKYKLEFELGFQNNFREEFSDYISHGFMPPVYPDFMTIPNTLERGFNKNTYSMNAKAFFSIKKHHFSVGFNGEHHNNNIDGWGFIIPEYKQSNGGLFVYDKFDLTEKIVLHAGLRYDLGTIETENYFDWFTTPIEGNETNLQRAFAMQRDFSNLSWSVGANYNLENVLLRTHFGKSFRMPIAKELASNGVNYHQFSYELGNPNLSAEESYQFDFGITWQQKRFNLDINPFVNYFPNYIYLNPTPDFDFAYGAGNQIFEYTESEVLRYGGEVKLNYAFTENYHTEIIGEYVYAEQQSGLKKGFTLPFSPPPSVLLNFTYKKDFKENFKNGFAGIDFKYVGPQNEIVPPEEKTPGYELINLAFGGDLVVNKQLFQINFQVQNLLNSKNLNHTSFYRLIGVPEPGRNFVLTVKIPFMISNGS